MLKKIFLLSIFIIVAFSSIVTGVFAWFANSDDRGKVQHFDPLVRPNVELQIEANQDEIFLGDKLRDLVYITDTDFNTTGFDFYGYASFFEIIVTNPTSEDTVTRISLSVQGAPEFGDLAGIQSGLKYLVIADPSDTQSLMFQFQSTSNVYNAMQAYNGQGIEVPANTTMSVYIAIWGFYDGLTTAQKEIYHAIIYRVKFIIT